MIWSLLKVLLFIAAIAAMTFGADMLLHSQDGVRIAVAGWELTLGPLQSAVLLLLLVLVLWLVMKLVGLLVATLRFLNGDETAISRYFDRNRERKGYQALSEGLMAVASGEGRLALIKAQRAEKYLGRPELTTLLVAQAAEVAGVAAHGAATREVEDFGRLVGKSTQTIYRWLRDCGAYAPERKRRADAGTTRLADATL